MNAILKLQQIKNILLYERENNRLKTTQQVTCVVYLCIVLSRMYERDATIEKEFDTELQMKR